MASGYVQDAGNKAAVPTASWAITMTVNPTAGNLILLEVTGNGSTTCDSVTDSKGNTWTAVRARVATTGTVVWLYQFYTLQNVGTLTTSDSVTVSMTVGTGTAACAMLREIASTVAPDVNQGAANSSSSTTANTGTTGTTAQANELVWESLATWGTVSSWTQDASFSLPTTSLKQTVNSGRTLLSAYKDVSATGTFSGSNTLGTAAGTATIITTFKTASTGAPGNTVAPAVTGTTTVGQTLSCSQGTWTNSPSSFAYQWQSDNQGGGSYSNIASATASTYVLTDAEDTCNIKCIVTATNGSGSTPAASNVVGTVIEPVPSNTVAPALSGSAQVGQTMNCSTGTWTGMGGVNPVYTYQWQDSADGSTGWAAIVGATANTYSVAGGELAKFLRCVVTADNSNATNPSANSNVSSAVIAAGTAARLRMLTGLG